VWCTRTALVTAPFLIGENRPNGFPLKSRQ
jgi:hypothetical protein